ncbi:ATP-binding protein [Danxiaibacter flavus]|uniref:ATP-binding protein n=1 Tax=Danxiaibacter flavus TaxID=3049108 RepID=A0ABV3ZMH0_9BACT|nr:ATP-binding protein [Chitinophagaceae bacterium DXS]
MAQFRTKARAVELLGKGQIADLPTAISELWKNGYDAYGDKLEAALYMPGYQQYPDPVFVLSDDGKGMDKEDVLNKWFVLGTDSKTRGEADVEGPDTTLNKRPRVKMGEKGIGRLAVAYLGPQMLMLTKKKKCPLEMVFFDWRILENYDLFLSDVNIPIRSITSVDAFEEAFLQLKEEFLLNFPEIRAGQSDPWKDQQELKVKIISECEQLSVPEFITEDWIADMLQKPVTTHSTRFVIFQSDEQLVQLTDFTKREAKVDKDDTTINHTVSTLVGLFNLFKNEEPEHKTYFWIYESDETGRYDLLTHRAFFNPNDFTNCDHLIEGEFDGQGEFVGKVRIYNKTVPHKFVPQKKKGNTTYGSFKIKMGYVNPLENQSLVKGENKRAFDIKLDLYSGLFIYRDGFRVLPYGRQDTDFLEFEERRGKHAGENFFAKRNMFGYIEITRKHNEKLKDKSSREGFINNQAYRDFKTDLIAFFRDLAKKYFATRAEYSYKEDQQDDLIKRAVAEKQEHERDNEARKNFAKELKDKPQELENLQAEFQQHIASLKQKSLQENLAYEQIQQLMGKVEDCKTRLTQYKVAKPARFKPTELQSKKFHAYNKIYASVVKAFEQSEEVLRPVRDKLKVHELFKEFEEKAIYYENTLSRYYQDYEGDLAKVFDKIRSEFNSEKAIFLAEFGEKHTAIIPARNNATEIGRSLKILETIFKESQERIRNRVEPYLNHLRRLSFDVNEDNLVGYYKDQFEEMKEEWNKTYELAQLGIAVEIIDHQFNTIYAQMAESIKNIQPYLKAGKDPHKFYRHLSNAFEHLQDNYKLLQPIYRTTGRVQKDITGKELKEYTEEFFESRLNEHNIKFTITDQAKKWTVKSYESIFKPVLINIVNNAIYWLQRVDDKEIRIDVDGNNLLIMNSGMPIEDHLLEDIFKLFYSERPKGRGIGLYLAKQSLNGIGFDIEASNEPKYNRLNGACFIIKPISTL